MRLSGSPHLVWRLRWAAWAAGLAVTLLALRAFFLREIYHFTGDAKWIWMTDDLSKPTPRAAIFQSDLVLEARPCRATAKVSADREFVLWINGRPALAETNRPGFALDVVDVAELLKPGTNSVAVEARSPDGVGGVLFALDIEPCHGPGPHTGPEGRNVLVSNGKWQVCTTWSKAAALGACDSPTKPHIWGAPPMFPWGYPQARFHPVNLFQAISGEEVELKQDPNGEFHLPGISGFLVLERARAASHPTVCKLHMPGGDISRTVFMAGQTRLILPRWVQGTGSISEEGCRLKAVKLLPALSRDYLGR